MLRHHGGEHVASGFYVNVDPWEITSAAGLGGVTLAGDASVRYVRIPTFGMLLMAPLLGALFAIFLPFIGLHLVAQLLTEWMWRLATSVTRASLTAVSHAWHPAAAHVPGGAFRSTAPPPAGPAEADESTRKDPAAEPTRDAGEPH